jgi:hypothetical protein
MNDPAFGFGARVRFRAGRLPTSLKHAPENTGVIVKPFFGQQAPVAGLIYAEFPVVGAVWVSPGVEPVEER